MPRGYLADIYIVVNTKTLPTRIKFVWYKQKRKLFTKGCEHNLHTIGRIMPC